MKQLVIIAAAILTTSSSLCAEDGWQLVWSDEFSGQANTLPDASKWAYDTGGGGWGNNELERYTSDPQNVSQNGKGLLAIRALKNGSSYSSARIKTQGKYTTTYGRIEARIKVPYGKGIWPAFWMLGSDIGTVNWPRCGEIDIMEYIGAKDPSTSYATVHGPGYSGSNPIGNKRAVPGKLSDDFHVFSVEWKQNPDQLEFFIDGISYHKVTPDQIPKGTEWVFNKPFFIILNVAVGGNWPGYPDDTTEFPAEMLVDYVRVFRWTSGPAVHAGGVVNAASFARALAPGALGSIFGFGLAGDTRDGLFDAKLGAFPPAMSNVQVKVNGVAAPLTFISGGQINFQIPWETPVGTPVDVQVVRDGVVSGSEQITLASAAPSAYAANGAAIVDCPGGPVRSRTECVIWGNGFGALNVAQQNGVPSVGGTRTTGSCRLTVGGVQAEIRYCGGAPGLVIDQLNFIYPENVATDGGTAAATLSVGDNSADFLVPAPTGV